MDIHKLNRIFKIDSIIATILVFLLLLILPFFFKISFFQPFYQAFSDLEITDYQYAEIRNEATLVDTSIVIVNIDDTSNVKLILFLNNILQFNIKAIGIHNIITKSSEEEINNYLKQLITDNKEKIILAFKFTKYSLDEKKFTDILLPSEEVFDQNELKKLNLGYTNLFQNIDNIEENLTVRNFFPYYKFKGIEYRSFATEILRIVAPEKEKALKSRQNEFETINYLGNIEKFIFLEFEQALHLDSNFYKNKIVLIGDAPALENVKPLKKMYFTPMNERAGGRTFPDMFPVVIQANIISMLLNQSYYDRLPNWLAIIITFLICYINMIFFFYISDKHRVWFELATMVVFVIESIFILYITIVLFHNYNFELNLTMSIFAIALSLPVSELYYQFLKPIIKKIYIIKKRSQ